jgi:hypothetical protein
MTLAYFFISKFFWALLIALIINTISWRCIKALVRTPSLSWAALFCCTWIGGIVSIFIIGDRIQYMYYIIPLCILLSFSISFLTALIASKISLSARNILNGFLCVVIPLTLALHFISYCSFEWTVDATNEWNELSNRHGCRGFPLPFYGDFFQGGTSGAHSLYLFNYILDFLFDTLASYLIYYWANRLINFRSIVPKFIVITFCICIYWWLSFLPLFSFADEVDPWPVKVVIYGLHFNWGG